MKILTIVGARPQFIKAAPVSRTLRRRCTEILLHTGQHYDSGMSDVFFDELDLPKPDYNLAVGSGSHAAQTAQILVGVEETCLRERPDRVLVYGDTNSTLAGALAAAKLQIPVAHVEAGLRSFNRRMPEEINRIATDRISSLLFCPTTTAVGNLRAEGIERGVHLVGDVMYDSILAFDPMPDHNRGVLDRLGLARRGYLLATVHRASNTDDPTALAAILGALGDLDETVVFPVHPRTEKALGALGIGRGADLLSRGSLRLIDPVGYIDMLVLERNARLILTDSGGIQKEAYFFRVPCLTLRDETEWTETVEAGWNCLVGADRQRILRAVREFSPDGPQPAIFGDGRASEAIADLLVGAG